MASRKNVSVEMMPYRPKGTPQQGDEGLLYVGTKDGVQAQLEAVAKHLDQVRLRKLGLEPGEPMIFLPRNGGWVLGTWKRRPQGQATFRKDHTPCGVSVASHLHGTFITFAIFTSHR